jgi:nicotinamide-nucleotide amidase
MTAELEQTAKRVAQRLARTQTQIVLAESRTGGMVAATLAQIAGISQYLCGSAVVYQEQTKTAWLQIPANLLQQFGAVSPQIAEQMAEQVLRQTPQATLALSITGHLGPHAPPELDGVVYLGVARSRAGDSEPRRTSVRHRLAPAPRPERQQQAALLVLQTLDGALEDTELEGGELERS